MFTFLCNGERDENEASSIYSPVNAPGGERSLSPKRNSHCDNVECILGLSIIIICRHCCRF